MSYFEEESTGYGQEPQYFGNQQQYYDEKTQTYGGDNSYQDYQMQQEAYEGFVPAPEMGQAITLQRGDPNDYGYQDPYVDPYNQMYPNTAEYEYGYVQDPYMEYNNAAVMPPSKPKKKKSKKSKDKNREKKAANIPKDNFDTFKYSDDDIKPKRFMYGCVPVNRTCRWITIIIIFLLIVIGVLAFIFYPRLPELSVLSILPNGNNSYQLTNFDQNNPNNFKFSMNMLMDASLINTNSYYMKIDKISLTILINANGTTINEANPSPAQNLFSSSAERVYVTANNYQSQIGVGNYGTLLLPAKVNTTFQMAVNIIYTPGPLGAINDPALNEIIQLCVEGDPAVDTGRRTVISYTAVSTVSALEYIGYKPTLSGDLRIRCPFQGAARTAFIKAITGGNGVPKR